MVLFVQAVFRESDKQRERERGGICVVCYEGEENRRRGRRKRERERERLREGDGSESDDQLGCCFACICTEFAGARRNEEKEHRVR